jgi:hypothetical protein
MTLYIDGQKAYKGMPVTASVPIFNMKLEGILMKWYEPGISCGRYYENGRVLVNYHIGSSSIDPAEWIGGTFKE